MNGIYLYFVSKDLSSWPLLGLSYLGVDQIWDRLVNTLTLLNSVPHIKPIEIIVGKGENVRKQLFSNKAC